MRTIRYIGATLFLLIIFLQSCISPTIEYTKLPPGEWRGVLYLDPGTRVKPAKRREVILDVDRSADLPFNFRIDYIYDDKFDFILLNGPEEIKADSVEYGRDLRTAKDTITAHFSIYDSYLKGVYEESMIEGHWHVNYRESYSIGFKAHHGRTGKFDTDGSIAEADFSGQWNVVFDPESKKAYGAIGVFEQNDKHIKGTFMTETGDYRYLSGSVMGNKMYLSTFDASHAFLVEGKMMEDGSISGLFRSGTHYTVGWSATKTEKAELVDAFELTKLTERKNEALILGIPDTEGNIVSLNADQYLDKYKIIYIMGTWCPNCKDQSEFLDAYFKENENKEIEIIAVGFERYKDFDKQLQQLKNYKEKENIKFPVLVGGHFNKSEAGKLFPQIDELRAYPTLLFLDKDNRVKHVHTGFSGPATPEYEKYKLRFKQIIDSLINP
jgi:thiol-disulfide isomerase/thioredoxin